MVKTEEFEDGLLPVINSTTIKFCPPVILVSVGDVPAPLLNVKSPETYKFESF